MRTFKLKIDLIDHFKAGQIFKYGGGLFEPVTPSGPVCDMRWLAEQMILAQNLEETPPVK